jgi:hypothetical protein
MIWIDDLRVEVQRWQVRGTTSGRESRQSQAASADEAVASADALVRALLDQMKWQAGYRIPQGGHPTIAVRRRDHGARR